jgi:hypothetical protein
VNELLPVSEFKDGNNWPQLKDQFEIHFMGKTGAMFKWLYFALEVQFADFLSGQLTTLRGSNVIK